ncbi:hypothetical protein M3Y94_00346100 [Aphelenchoides besseyi]|nr:hypothetical protein M3Y94_00346100 [Aphelenchoides besseyi]KAI6235393.1 Ubiquitin-like domain-containing protein [Aphelenchoides besseyi]
MNVVQILVREKGKCFPTTIELEANDTVEQLTEKISQKIKLNRDQMRVIFCGQRLSGDSKISDLQLGSQTALTVTITNEPCKSKSPDLDNDLHDYVVVDSRKEIVNKKTLSSFYVYCKKCDKLQIGKLRAYCCKCGNNAIEFLNEPSNFQDITSINKIAIKCVNCAEQDTYARFLFKCLDCSEESPLLSCVRLNKHDRECVICSDVEPLIFSMDNCAHSSCIPCISAYLEQLLNQWLFVYRSEVGFTMQCVMIDCKNFVKDSHHYYLIGGVEKYNKFQKMAAEKFLSIQDGFVYCADANCNAGFVVENDEEETSTEVMCPECQRVFCTQCRNMGKCTCGELNQTIEVIKHISKPCPQCRAPTERSGGCSHLQCTNCAFNWCFICGKEWTTDCQWDHWFE